MLSIQKLHAFYGKSHILHGVSLDVKPGEIVSLLGRNGSGRSTTIKAIMGLVDAQGSVKWNGRELLGHKTYDIARHGLGYVPESRDVFPKLTVEQNLLLGQKGGQKGGRWSLDDMYQLFPRLKERQHTEAGVMSGGEQQMLTLCRTLMGDPDLIMIDEPTEGLAPKIVEQVGEYLKALQKRGLAVLLVEQKLTIALDISQRCYVMGHGEVVFHGTPDELRADQYVRKEWLEV
ncbi:MAG: ABC transporter ATP-binding protein [Aquabacterium sp.]|jgi:branched-chain amino acid transport system ATP-binding protein|uniref:ABC transporter ATP-binding protein n=1 Tax=Aquabacterium sp. TaxID=1872578 RepID=UPI001B4B25FE|nr:ABC transporter ATP-binding protein [Aquabacterium sp.]MBP7133068.1 ABC transporter ATP-binding protein [Aquabacterium sp.]MDQ5925335.1 branched-chain amino acid transport system ATP-binding protein [Pseudomonadota bacterium]